MEHPHGLAGLSQAEAAARLVQVGPNRLREPRRRNLIEITRNTLREPMFLLLVAAAVLYLVFGSLGEGLFMVAGAILSLGLVIGQELRSEHALAALDALAQPMARVIRDGRERTIPAAELVPEDLVMVGEGGRLPADGVLIAGDALTVDESALTGESAPVSKTLAASGPRLDDDPDPGEDRTPDLFAATLVVRGQGIARVRRTGAGTRVGRIGAELAEAREEPTLAQRDLRRLIGRLGIVAILFCAFVAIVFGLVRGDWLRGALTGITLAISLIPEEFPMVLAIFMALGAWRLARRNILVRRAAVIETLGATTLLCVDKTGTLTENRMALVSVWKEGRFADPADKEDAVAAAVIRAAQLASVPHPNDPMDEAIHRAACRPLLESPVRSWPLRPDFLAFAQAWTEENDELVFAVKGAPETVLPLCDLKADVLRATEEAVLEMAERGMRVLAAGTVKANSNCSDPARLRYRFEGLLGFLDPVRADVPAALEQARRAGVTVAMITGDFPATALAIARAAGIDTSRGVITGADLERSGTLGPDQLATRVFARIMPEQKLKLVQAFRQAGHVVAMTGDGINDAPALAAADIGIAMGKRGTDVAREASDLILLDDRFASIIGGIRLGRRIFANLRRAMSYITAIHIPVAGLALLPLILGLPPLLYPMHLVLLELLIDPVCALVFEGQESRRDMMEQPPRPSSETLFGRSQILLSIVQGAMLLAAILGLYAWLIRTGAAADKARAAAFVALIAGQLSLAFAEIASGDARLFGNQQRPFWAIVAISAATIATVLLVPGLRSVLEFSPPPGPDLVVAAVAGTVGGGWYALKDLLSRRPA